MSIITKSDMKVGYFGQPNSREHLFESIEIAQRGGFDMFGIADSQSLFRELQASLGALATRADSISFGPFVTNPRTRHPVVTASALCTLEEYSDGSAMLGIGTGHSAVSAVGERPARLAELEGVITLFKNLCQGRSTTYQGTSVELEWVKHASVPKDIPVYMAAEGPKTQRLAAQIADGIIIPGPDEELVTNSVNRIIKSAERSDRDPDEFEIWVKTRANVADNHEKAVNEIKHSLADYAAVTLKSGLDGKNIPAEYRDDVNRFINEYESHSSYYSANTRNEELLNELDILDFFIDRYGIVGTPVECIAKLESIDKIDRITGVMLSGGASVDRKQIIKGMATEVIPNLNV